MRQQFERAAPLAVLVEGKSVAIGLIGSERDRAGEIARGLHRRHFRLVSGAALGAHAADRNASGGQALVGIVGA